jgi:hypothetical protein
LEPIGAGYLHDENDAQSDALSVVLGVGRSPLVVAEKNCLVKEGLAWLAPLGKVTAPAVNAADVPAVAVRASLVPRAGAAVRASFDDGKAAVVENRVGRGSAWTFGFFPGAAYLQRAIPKRPFDRGTSDDNFNHFLPTRFDRRAQALALWPLVGAKVSRAVFASPEGASDVTLTGDHALPPLDVGLIDAPEGTAVPIANLSGTAIPKLTVTVRVPGAGAIKEARAARAGKLAFTRAGELVTVTLPVDWADLVVFKR